MKKIIFYSLILMSLLCAPQIMAQSTMTDNQVLEYVKKASAAGKNQKEMLQELALKGVDRAQAERVKKLYEKELANAGKSADANASRKHVQKKTNDQKRQNTGKNGIGKTGAEEYDNEFEESYSDGDYLTEMNASEENVNPMEVFGRNIFRNRNLSFEPGENVPTPKNYVLGPGDEVIIEVFGANQNTIRSEISPEGYINVEMLGPVYLSGRTLEAANVYLKNKLASIYEGLAGGEDVTDIQISLGQIRTIQVSIVGEVMNPGSYNVSSLSTVFNAMFQAGGVVDPGTIRSIKVVRNNKIFATADVYELLISGSRKNDVRLDDGDVILVEPYNKIVKVNGSVKRPIYFEMKDKETVADVIKYAGGFSKEAFVGNVSVVRQRGQGLSVTVVESEEFGSFVLEDGDEIEVKKVTTRFENRISISGNVYLPGIFELNNDVNSIRKLIGKAGGLTPDAFTERALIYRLHEDLSRETMGVDLAGILSGKRPDVALQNNDSIVVNSIYELEDYGTLTINGEVASPGVFAFAENTTVQDLVLMAGGLLRSASTVRIDIARRISDSESLVAQSAISTYFTFSMQDGFAVDGADSFILEPYDVVTVRRSPSFVADKVVTISGEVNFPGSYNMSKREERVSDLIAKAGNLTNFAYHKGATLIRKMTEAEREKLKTLLQTAATENDQLLLEGSTKETYQVSFDLEEAIKNPGCEDDLVLREGDELVIPVYNNTIRVAGAVQMETTLSYRKGLSKKDVINAAGGYAKRALKRKVFIAYMNGRVSKLNRFTKIEPGSQIYVPRKEKKEGQVQQNMAIATSIASLGMMAVSIANLLK